jgi:hypothetical protein
MGHLEEISMNFYEHLFRAWRNGVKSIYAGIILMIHGLFPDCFIHTGSDMIHDINLELNNSKKLKLF